jgi:hypothetical protein
MAVESSWFRPSELSGTVMSALEDVDGGSHSDLLRGVSQSDFGACRPRRHLIDPVPFYSMRICGRCPVQLVLQAASRR